MAEDKKEKKVKFYNPYPFPVRMMNDLNKEQTLAPQGHGKVFRNRYDQSKLDLPIRDKGKEKLYKPGLDLDLVRILKSDLVDLAWAVVIGSKQELEGRSKRQLIEAIREKVGEEELEEAGPRPELPDDTVEEQVQEESERAADVSSSED